jgi:HlyD family secretion protein
MKRKRIVIFIIIAIASVFGISAFIWKQKGSNNQSAESAEQLGTVEAVAGSVSVKVEGPALIEPFEKRIIRASEDGTVLSIASQGDFIEEGGFLVVFDGTEKERLLRQAGLNVSKAELNRSRSQKALEEALSDLSDKTKLFESGALSREEVDGAASSAETARFNYESSRLDYEQAILTLENAEDDLANATIKAPFSGVVLDVELLPGDIAGKGAVLLTFADLSKVRLKAEVDEFDIGKVQVGQKVSVTSDFLGDKVVGSKVEMVSPAAEVINNISIFTVSTVLKNEDGLFRPGMSADLSILISSDKGLIVPSKAVSSVRTRSYIKVYNEGEVENRRITIGADDGVNTAVLEGLDEGELVVVPMAPAFQLGSASSEPSGSSVIPVSVPGAGGSR